MKLKHFGLLAVMCLLSWACSDNNNIANSNGMGEINATFSANYRVRPSMEAEGEQPENGNEEAIAPEIQDFALKLTKSDGSYTKTWPSIAEFTAGQKFTTGIYSMEIYYGNINVEGFGKPYYYGMDKFEVIDEETSTPSIEAKLANAMVSITYTDAFKNYFSSYSAKLRTASGNIIEFTDAETRPAYVKPGKVTIQLSATKTNGTELSLEPAEIESALACTHYKVKFDVNGGEVGDAVLSITFDDATTTEPIEVKLSDELMLAPAPVLTTKGFDNNTSINIIEGDEATASVAVMAQSGLAAVTLNTDSEYLLANGWQSELNLMVATAEQQAMLKSFGLDVKGLWKNPDKMAIIDFSGLIPKLKPFNGNSTHKFTVQVKDVYNRVAESAVILTVNAPAVIFSMGDAQKSEAGTLEGKFTLTFNGNMNKVSFKALTDYGNYVDAPIKNYVDNHDGTYLVTVTIPDNANSTIIKGLYDGVEKSSVSVKIGLAFSLTANDYDVWATKAIVKVNSKTQNLIVNGVKKVLVNGTETSNYSIDKTNGLVTVMGLTAGALNVVKVVSENEGEESESSITVTTEKAIQVPNSDMESWSIETKTQKDEVTQGYKTYYNFLPYTNGESDTWWATNNQIGQNGTIAFGIWWEGCFASSTSYTTDAHGGNKAAYIFTNGHGRHYADTESLQYTGGSYIGSLFIGSFNYYEKNYDGEPIHGHSFSSRPSSLSFWYKYKPYNTDAFKVWVAIKSGDEIIAEGTYIPATSTTEVSSYTQATVNLDYTVINKKATTICVQFLSSTKSSISSKDINKNVTINYPEVGEWKAHRGSELWIDDLNLNY